MGPLAKMDTAATREANFAASSNNNNSTSSSAAKPQTESIDLKDDEVVLKRTHEVLTDMFRAMAEGWYSMWCDRNTTEDVQYVLEDHTRTCEAQGKPAMKAYYNELLTPNGPWGEHATVTWTDMELYNKEGHVTCYVNEVVTAPGSLKAAKRCFFLQLNSMSLYQRIGQRVLPGADLARFIACLEAAKASVAKQDVPLETQIMRNVLPADEYSGQLNRQQTLDWISAALGSLIAAMNDGHFASWVNHKMSDDVTLELRDRDTGFVHVCRGKQAICTFYNGLVEKVWGNGASISWEDMKYQLGPGKGVCSVRERTQKSTASPNMHVYGFLMNAANVISKVTTRVSDTESWAHILTALPQTVPAPAPQQQQQQQHHQQQPFRSAVPPPNSQHQHHHHPQHHQQLHGRVPPAAAVVGLPPVSPSMPPPPSGCNNNNNSSSSNTLPQAASMSAAAGSGSNSNSSASFRTVPTNSNSSGSNNTGCSTPNSTTSATTPTFASQKPQTGSADRVSYWAPAGVPYPLPVGNSAPGYVAADATASPFCMLNPSTGAVCRSAMPQQQQQQQQQPPHQHHQQHQQQPQPQQQFAQRLAPHQQPQQQQQQGVPMATFVNVLPQQQQQQQQHHHQQQQALGPHHHQQQQQGMRAAVPHPGLRQGGYGANPSASGAPASPAGTPDALPQQHQRLQQQQQQQPLPQFGDNGAANTNANKQSGANASDAPAAAAVLPKVLGLPSPQFPAPGVQPAAAAADVPSPGSNSNNNNTTQQADSNDSDNETGDNASQMPTFECPCDHNKWDSVRIKRKWCLLRCRVCESHWRLPACDIPSRRCTSFVTETCENTACPYLHIYLRKQRLGERMRRTATHGTGQQAAAPVNTVQQQQPAYYTTHLVPVSS